MAHGDEDKIKDSTILPPSTDDLDEIEDGQKEEEVNPEYYAEAKNQIRATRAVISNDLMAPWLRTRDSGHYNKGTIVGELKMEKIMLDSADQMAAYYIAKERMRTKAAEAKAGIDELSGLGNRRAFNEKFKVEFKRAERHETPLSLIVIDIDHFKRVNDLLGHQAGDEALKAVADILKGLRETDTAFRNGGEEFAIILPETENGDAMKVAEKIRKAVATKLKTFLITEYGLAKNDEIAKQIAGTISVGIASYGKQKTPDELFKQADDALYRAKQTGRNRVINASHMSSKSLQKFEAVAIDTNLEHIKKMEALLPADPVERKKMIDLFIQRNSG